MKQLFGVTLLVVLSVSMGVLLWARNRTHAPVQAEDFALLPKGERPAALFNSPEFAFRDQTGRAVTKTTLQGQPYIANFIFTTCRTVCPLLTAKMVRLQRELKDVPLRFVSFSVDPEHDTVDALAAYAKQWNPDEARWSLLETTTTGLGAVADGFHVTAQKTDGGIDAVMHSAVFVLVDERGVVRGVFDSEESDDFKALTRSARALVGTPEPARPTVARSGEVLFHELSCANCHERAELAPQLGGLLGQQRELDTRLMVKADEAYLKESILAPEVKRVVGYPLKMPSYAGHLTNEELDGLVKYVIALPAPSAPSPDVTLSVDPVCHMKVRVTDNTLHVGENSFCSAWCKARFEENPDAYRH